MTDYDIAALDARLDAALLALVTHSPAFDDRERIIGEVAAAAAARLEAVQLAAQGDAGHTNGDDCPDAEAISQRLAHDAALFTRRLNKIRAAAPEPALEEIPGLTNQRSRLNDQDTQPKRWLLRHIPDRRPLHRRFCLAGVRPWGAANTRTIPRSRSNPTLRPRCQTN